jgi:site-specific DNA-adenine methylase
MDDLIFIDPPYLNTTEGNNKDYYNEEWTIKDEQELYKKLKELDKRGIKFMITNTIQNKGNINIYFKNLIEELNLYTEVLSTQNNAFMSNNNDYLELVAINYEPPMEQITFEL